MSQGSPVDMEVPLFIGALWVVPPLPPALRIVTGATVSISWLRDSMNMVVIKTQRDLLSRSFNNQNTGMD